MTATPSAEEVAGIAKGLTKAQRNAFRSPRIEHIRFDTMPAARCALQRKGLVVDQMYCERLTPLGLAVRRYLQEHLHV